MHRPCPHNPPLDPDPMPKSRRASSPFNVALSGPHTPPPYSKFLSCFPFERINVSQQCYDGKPALTETACVPGHMAHTSPEVVGCPLYAWIICGNIKSCVYTSCLACKSCEFTFERM